MTTINVRASYGALRGVAVATTFALAVGCVDKEKCEQAVTVTRDALAKEQTDIARQWRDRAWKMCDDPAGTQALDKEIVDKEAEIRKRAEDAAKAAGLAAQQRMNTATAVWKGFDALDEKERTLDRLEPYREKASRMSTGLAPEYAQQVDVYNAREYAKRRAFAEAAAKKK
jgi:hypothetical protein